MKKLIFYSLLLGLFSYINTATAQNDPTSDDWVTNAGNTSTTTNVGIGIASPIGALHVVGDMRVGAGVLRVNNSNGFVGFGTNSPNRPMHFFLNNSSTQGQAKLEQTGTGDATFQFLTAGNFWSVGVDQSIGNVFAIQNNTSLNSGASFSIMPGTGYVGIGTTSPSTELDVDGVITATGGTSTLWNMAHGWGDHAGAGYLTAETDPQVGVNSTNYASKWNGTALISSNIYSNGTFAGVNTNTSIGSSQFVVGNASSGYGGMYLASTGTPGSRKPFYGYSLDGAATAWTYLDEATGQWRVWYGGDRMVVESTGKVGIGTTAPSADLHITPNSSNYALRIDQGTSGDGILTYVNTTSATKTLLTATSNVTGFYVKGNGFVGIGTSLPSEKLTIDGGNIQIDGWNFYDADIRATGGNTGMRMYDNGTFEGGLFYEGSNNSLYLSRAFGVPTLAVADNSLVGIGTIAPTAKLHVDVGTAENYGIRVDNDYTGTSSKYGIFNQTDAGGTGQRFGFYNDTDGNGSDPSSVFGNYNLTTSNGSSASVYGVYSSVSTSGTGNRYAIYGTASTTAPSPTTRSWAGYFSGNTYFSSDMRIGWLDDVPGYLLAVDGKIICEELQVELSSSWPDYVFKKDYDLWSLEDVEKYIDNNNHLPGVPAAECIESDGVSVGEMSKIMMEKIEELTLHVIEQSKQIKELQNENGQLHKKLHQ